jgi:catechol 2,3-dioxygenase-like lactoylglutathione lyase family enzyme
MNRFAAAILALFLCALASAEDKHPRPRILGIFAVHFYTTSLSDARKFYAQILDPGVACNWCEEEAFKPISISLPSKQLLRFTVPNGPAPSNLLAEIVLATNNVEAMKEYLGANKIRAERPSARPGSLTKIRDPQGLTVLDPDGHRISFIQLPPSLWSSSNTDALRIIHAGFVVHDRAATDHFYKDILGFRPYWHGGMKDDKDDWVAMQVPDGTDWLEYMLNISPNADHHTLGVMNHIALGVSDIQATDKQLIANGWNPTEEPKMGRDGKWQLNVYDPDDTRTEFMEFKPAQEPCCSAFTGPHPGPK